MSAISDKLLYLDVTRSKIKDTINYTGAGITESDTFRSYARTLKDSFVDIINDGTGTLYDNFPKATDEGSETTLNDVYAAPMELEIEGKIEQDSYSGKNLFDYKSASDVNNTIVSTYRLFEINGLKPNTQYNINRMGFTETLNNQYCYLWDNNVYASANRLSLCTPTYLYNKVDFISNSEGKMYLAIYPTDTNVWQELIPFFEDAQIEEGSSETSYEPYVGGTPSPNPNYPQEIKTVSGIENLFNKDDTSMLLENINISSSSGIVQSVSGNTCICVPCKPNTTYYMSKLISSRFVVGSYPTIPVAGNTLNNYKNNNSGSEITITTGLSDNYLIAWVYYASSDTLTKQEILDSIQVREGTTPHTPVPYGHWLPVKVSNKNLFDKDNANILNAYINNKTIISLATTRILYIPCEPDTTYTISKIQSTRFTVISTVNTPANNVVGTNEVNNNRATSLTIATGSSDKYLAVFYYNSNSDILTEQEILNSIQIEEGTTATDYIEHQEQTTLIDLNKYDKNNNIIGNYELCSIGDVKDLLDIKDGKAIISKNVDRYTFTGNENWAGSTSYYTSVLQNLVAAIPSNQEILGYSNYFRVYGYNYMQPNNFYFHPNKNLQIQNVNNEFYPTLNDWKNLLKAKYDEGNPCYIDYELATPQEIELQGTYNLKTYEEVTHISIDDDLEPNMIASGLTWE